MPTRRPIAALAALLATFALAGVAPAASPTVSPSSPPVVSAPPVGPGAAWPFRGHDVAGTGATSGSGIDAQTVARLEPAWSVQVAGAVSATPIIDGDTVYVGSYGGELLAVRASDGTILWRYETGAAVPEPNLGIPLGITGSAAVVDGTVYVGDAAGDLHAIEAETGVQRWRVSLDDQPAASIWSSPVISDGRLLVGVASVAKEAGFRGSLVAVDPASGAILWQTFTVPEGADGGGVFGAPVVDEERGLVIVGTQNAYTEPAVGADPGDAMSVLALDAADGSVAWRFAGWGGESGVHVTDDVAFSASPNLFAANVDGTERDLVGIGQKQGVFHALDRDTGAPVWETTVSPAGFLGGMEGTSAVAHGIVAIPATDWPEFDGPATGLVRGLDAATGEVRWTAEQTAPAASSVAIADGTVLHAGMDGILHAYALGDGSKIWSADLGGSASGGVAVGDGLVVVGAATPAFAPFVRPGDTVQAFRIGAR